MGKIPEGVLEALMNDLNTPKALAILDEEKNSSDLLAGANFLGLLTKDYEEMFHDLPAKNLTTGKPTLSQPELREILSKENIKTLIAERQEAKNAKDFARADQIREDLKKKGILLEDGPDGTDWRVKD